MLDQTDDATATTEGAPEFHPEIDTLMGDLRDVLLGRVRTMQKPWEKMTEAEQYDLANAMELAAKDIIRRTVRALNDVEWPHTVVELGEVKIGGSKGIEAKITCGNIEHNRTVLGEHVGQHIMVLMVDSDRFMGQRGEPPIDKDQPALPGTEDAGGEA
jgi:hypothetical protein